MFQYGLVLICCGLHLQGSSTCPSRYHLFSQMFKFKWDNVKLYVRLNEYFLYSMLVNVRTWVMVVTECYDTTSFFCSFLHGEKRCYFWCAGLLFFGFCHCPTYTDTACCHINNILTRQKISKHTNKNSNKINIDNPLPTLLYYKMFNLFMTTATKFAWSFSYNKIILLN